MVQTTGKEKSRAYNTWGLPTLRKLIRSGGHKSERDRTAIVIKNMDLAH